MSSSQKTAIFMYAAKSFTVQCTGKEKVVELIKKFLTKFNPDSRVVDYNFVYEGNKIQTIDYEKTIEESEFGRTESFILTVEKNIKIIKCPKCNYDDCVVSLKDYRTIFYNCEHNHLEINSYDNYFTGQIFYPEKIICADCEQNGKNDPDYQLCLTCSNTTKRTKSICSKCIENHKKQNHLVIKYEDKNYYCQAHIKKFVKYCFQCKKNFCQGCVTEHENDTKYKGHHIKSFDLLIPEEKEITELKNSLKEINNSMESLKIIIKNLVYTLNGAMRIYTNYYNIAGNIIEKYESFNKGEGAFKNFTIFKCLRNLKKSNEQMLTKIREVVKEKNKLEQAKHLIAIYSTKKDEYYANTRSGEDLNEEDDTDWLKEVLEREKERDTKSKNDFSNGKETMKKKKTIHNKKNS